MRLDAMFFPHPTRAVYCWLSPQYWLKSKVLVENTWKGLTLSLPQNFVKRKGALLSCFNFSLPLIISANQANQQPQMTVGKIYCAKLIYENYKFMRRKGQIQAKVTDESDTFSRDVTAAMLMYRKIAKKVFWEFDPIILQNLIDMLPLFCTPKRAPKQSQPLVNIRLSSARNNMAVSSREWKPRTSQFQYFKVEL